MCDCIFCKIVNKDIPAKIIYEDDDMMAFHDINPAAPVHFLIIPKEHIATLSSCEERHAALLGKMSLLAARLAKEMGCAYQVDAEGEASGGFKTLINIGPDGGQEVYHLHMHVLGGKRPWHVKTPV